VGDPIHGDDAKGGLRWRSLKKRARLDAKKKAKQGGQPFFNMVKKSRRWRERRGRRDFIRCLKRKKVDTEGILLDRKQEFSLPKGKGKGKTAPREKTRRISS